jgi:hypothetical protein
VRIEQTRITRSRAHREGAGVRLVLTLPKVKPGGPTSAEVRFTCEGRDTTQPGTFAATQQGAVLDVTAPAEALAEGIWQLSYRPEGAAAFVRLGARLLTSDRQPIALIPSLDKAAPRRPQPARKKPARRAAPPPAPSSLARRVASRLRRELRRRIG